MEFDKLSKIDFNLNRLLGKKNPFQFRSDLSFQVLENGTYAISFRDSSDKLYYLAFFDSEWTLKKTISLPVQTESGGLRMYKYKNTILVSNSSDWCNRIMVVDESFELKSKDLEQDDEILGITANEKYIFCLMNSSTINFHDWNLELISSFTPASQDENMPFCVPSEISQLEIVDAKFVFKYENKIRIFDEDGRLLNECSITYDEFLVNHAKSQLVVWNREAHMVSCLSYTGQLLGEISLQEIGNDNLSLCFDETGEFLFVDLKNFIVHKVNSVYD